MIPAQAVCNPCQPAPVHLYLLLSPPELDQPARHPPALNLRAPTQLGISPASQHRGSISSSSRAENQPRTMTAAKRLTGQHGMAISPRFHCPRGGQWSEWDGGMEEWVDGWMDIAAVARSFSGAGQASQDGAGSWRADSVSLQAG